MSEDKQASCVVVGGGGAVVLHLLVLFPTWISMSMDQMCITWALIILFDRVGALSPTCSSVAQLIRCGGKRRQM